MTADPALVALLAPVRFLLLDFDGPVCSVFAGLPGPVVAQRLREVAAQHGCHVPLDAETERDPIAVFRRSGGGGPEVAAAVEQALRQSELEAITGARPTDGAAELLRACRQSEISVAVVSNNSADAIGEYLRRHRLAESVARVVGREADPSRLKPSPYLLHRAMAELGAGADHSLLLGDSVSDVEAARAAGIPVIGFANKPGKAQALRAADAVIAALQEFTTAVTTTCRHPPGE